MAKIQYENEVNFPNNNFSKEEILEVIFGCISIGGLFFVNEKAVKLDEFESVQKNNKKVLSYARTFEFRLFCRNKKQILEFLLEKMNVNLRIKKVKGEDQSKSIDHYDETLGYYCKAKGLFNLKPILKFIYSKQNNVFTIVKLNGLLFRKKIEKHGKFIVKSKLVPNFFLFSSRFSMGFKKQW